MRRPLLLTAVLFLGACGPESEAPPPVAPPPVTTSDEVPEEPADALDWVRAAHDRSDGAELRRRLAAWPSDSDAFHDTEETQVVLTWRLRVALQDGRLADALAAREALLAGYGGHGVSPEGRGLTPDMIRLGLMEEARLLARRRIEGAQPDQTAALATLDAAEALLAKDDAEDRARVAATRAWVTAHDMGAVLASVQATAGPGLGAPPGVSRASGALPHAFIVVLADDFALGEVILADVLRRWLREGKASGLTGVLLPIRRGEIRLGLRRVPVATEAEETDALRAHAQRIGLRQTSEPGSGLVAGTLRDGAALAKAMGLEGQEAGLLIVDRRGRIVGRLSGVGIDPRVLDPVIQKLTSR